MYLDADVLLALLKNSDYHKPYALRVVAETGRKYTSVLTLLELEIVVKRELGDGLSLSVGADVAKAVPGLKILNFSNGQFEKSLKLREKYGLGIFDAVHAVVCLENDGEIASTDHLFDRVPGLKRISP